MYERECTLRELDKESDATTSDLGEVLLKIVYDDDVYGARIVAHSLKSGDDGQLVCNHLIAMQTALEEGGAGVGGGCVWSALDFSHDPPAYRKFRAAFRNPDDEQEFRDTFYEGKELADQSEILELPPSADPESYYYGEGGDYEEDDKK